MSTDTNIQAPLPDPQTQSRLTGNMGVGEVVMSVLAFSSPLTTVAGFIPVLIMFSGNAAPGIYLMLTVLLLIFAVGFVRMSSTVKNPGGFYAFISSGLGKAAGLGGASLSLVGYLVIGFFAAPFFGVTAQAFVVSLGGPELPWYLYGVAIVIVTTILAYNKIDLSAKVLVIIMALEVLAVIVFNVFAFVHGGSSGENIGFTLPSFGSATIGLALLFAAGNFLGFEATVIYRNEVKNPDRTIPRATYLAVGGIGLFYALAAWAYIAFLGADNAQAVAEATSVTLFNDSVTVLIGKTFADIVTILLVTSILASALSIQNVAARYAFTLANDRALPSALGRVHPTQKSPYIAALLVGVLWIAATLFFGLIGSDPAVVFTIAVGIGSFSLILLLTFASLAVLVYFWRRRKTEGGPVLTTIIAPAVAFVGLAGISYLAIANYPDLIGGSVGLSVVLVIATFLVVALGAAWARVLKVKRPETYARLGCEPVDF